MFVSPKAHGPGTQTALWESSWQPHPPPEVSPQEDRYQADEVLFRVCKSCYNHHLDDVPPFLVISPHPAHGCLLSPSFHHQPHYSKIYNRPASSLSMLSAASIFPHRPPPSPAPVPCRLSPRPKVGGQATFRALPFLNTLYCKVSPTCSETGGPSLSLGEPNQPQAPFHKHVLCLPKACLGDVVRHRWAMAQEGRRPANEPQRHRG